MGVWHGTPYQIASVSSTANALIVTSGAVGRPPPNPKTSHRLTEDPNSGTWYARRVPLSDVTLAQPLDVITFSGAKPPAWANPYPNPSQHTFTFEVQAAGRVRLALVGMREADEAVVVVTKQAATATRLFRGFVPHVLMWTVSSHS